MAASARAARPDFLARLGFLALLAPSLVLLAAFLGLPLVVALATSLEPNPIVAFEGRGGANYAYLLSKPYYVAVVLRTLRIAALTAAAALVVGYAAALVLRGLSGRLANLAVMGLTFPILTGPLVVVLGWMALLTDGGPVLGPLVAAGLVAPPRLIGTETAVVLSLVQFTLPFVILTLYAALGQIPAQLHEAATSLGAGALDRFREVTLPLSLPGLLSAGIIAFSLAASSYVSPHYLGGAAQLTLTTLISQFVLATYNSPLAAAAAVLLLALMAATVVLASALVGRMVRP